MYHLTLQWMIKSFFVGCSPSGIKAIQEEFKNPKEKKEESSKKHWYAPTTSYKKHLFFGKLVVMVKNNEIAFGTLTFNGEAFLCSKNFSFSNTRECQFFTMDFCELLNIKPRAILGVCVDLKNLELRIQTKNKGLIKELSHKLIKQNFSKELKRFLNFIQEKNKQVFSLNFEREDIENMGWIGFQSDKIFIQRDENNYLQFKEGKPYNVELTNQTGVIASKEFRDFSVKKSTIQNLQNTNSNNFNCFVLQHPDKDELEIGIAHFEFEHAKSIHLPIFRRLMLFFLCFFELLIVF